MKLIRSAALAATLLATAVTANAGLIASDTTILSSFGESYAHVLSVSPSDYVNANLTVNIYGDYGNSAPNEHFHFYIDGVELLDLHSTSVPTNFTVTEIGTELIYNISGTLFINDLNWNTFSSDGLLNISWQNESDVNLFGENFVSWSLNGNEVPEPTSIALLGLGLLGLGISRKKKA